MTSKTKSFTKLTLAVVSIALLAYVAFVGVQIGNTFVGGALNMEKSGIKLGFDLSGGSVITYEASTNDITDEGMEIAISMLQTRLTPLCQPMRQQKQCITMDSSRLLVHII